MKKRIILAYVIGIHILIGVVLVKSDFIQRVEYKLGIRTSQSEITAHFHRMIGYHSRIDGNVPNQSVIFIGDSITQGLCVTAVANPSVNYGIGSDTTVGVLQRLPVYRSLEKASAVVIAIGINDMRYRSNAEILYNYRVIADKIRLTVPIIFSAVLPIDEDARDEWNGINNRRIKELNSKLKTWTETSARLSYVDVGSRLIDERGNLADELYDNDGVHLNSQGNAIWIQQLRESINDAQHVAPGNREQAPGS